MGKFPLVGVGDVVHDHLADVELFLVPFRLMFKIGFGGVDFFDHTLVVGLGKAS